MPTTDIIKVKTKSPDLHLRVASGHFATNHSHSNYYIDVSAQKSRLSEAKAVAQELCANYNYANKIVDTILCLDGTQVIGACLANELTEAGFANLNGFYPRRAAAVGGRGDFRPLAGIAVQLHRHRTGLQPQLLAGKALGPAAGPSSFGRCHPEKISGLAGAGKPV